VRLEILDPVADGTKADASVSAQVQTGFRVT
jgi:hypothetical protein